MKTIKIPEPDYYSLPDLAQCWGVAIERIHTYATAGTIDGQRLEVRPCGADAIPGVTPAERKRFESLGAASPRFPEGRFHPSDKASHEALIAALLVMCYGKRADLLMGPYELAGEIERDAARLGFQLERSPETNAKILREAQAALTAAGVTKGIQLEGDSAQTLDRAA